MTTKNPYKILVIGQMSKRRKELIALLQLHYDIEIVTQKEEPTLPPPVELVFFDELSSFPPIRRIEDYAQEYKEPKIFTNVRINHRKKKR